MFRNHDLTISHYLSLFGAVLLLASCRSVTQAPQPLRHPELTLSAADLSPFTQAMSLASAEISFIGEARDDEMGYSLAPAGDVNGDGLSDFIMGAWSNDYTADAAGQVYLILGRREADWGHAYSAANADASFVGEREFDIAGDALAPAGDVDADGFDDFLIGAQGWDMPGAEGTAGISDVGKAHLIFGQEANRWGMRQNLAETEASFIGLANQDFSASTLAAVGDVNGDGFDDFAIGDFRYHPLQSHMTNGRGRVYLALGHERDVGFARVVKRLTRRPTLWQSNVPLSEVAASIVGMTDGDFVGFSIAGIGDMNRDNLDDFLIGAWGTERNNGHAHGGEGQSYLITGRQEGWEQGMSVTSAVSSFIGEHPIDRSGWSVANLGDVNSDGFDDIGISAPRYGGPDRTQDGDGMGKVYVIAGQGDLWPPDSNLADCAMASFLGETRGDDAGFRVAPAGDVNGDGYADILISAPENSENAIKSGKVYLVFGSADGLHLDMPLAEVGVSFLGANPWDRAGWTATGLGDVNGDGFDDFAIGSRYSDTGLRNAGEVYLFLGRPQSMD